MTIRRIISLIILVITAYPLFAANNVDEFVERSMKGQRIPGLALLVVKDGKIVVEKGYGYSNLEHMVPVKPETIFQSGSVGKQFTATAIMMLVEQGKIQLDDPVSKYLPNTPDSWKNITVRHMLTHTSGLGDYPEDFDYRHDVTEDQELEIVKKTPLLFQPGEKWSYSNLAYLTLGILIHKVSGVFYGDFLQEHVFRPLGMTSTRIINEPDIIPNRAAGYIMVGDQWKNQEWVAPTINTTADGSLYFNIIDLAKWDAALYTEKLLKKSSFDQMWTPVRLNSGSTYPYGFGWGIAEVKGHRLLEHSGSWQGFETHIARYVNDKLTVVVLTNFAEATPSYIAHGVAGLYLPDVALRQHTRIQLPADQLKRFEGEYKFDTGQNIKITAAPDRLIYESGETKRELLPESPTSFFIEYSETTISFETDQQGNVTALVRHTDVDEKAPKVK